MSVRKAKTFPFVCGVRVAAKVNPFLAPGMLLLLFRCGGFPPGLRYREGLMDRAGIRKWNFDGLPQNLLSER